MIQLNSTVSIQEIINLTLENICTDTNFDYGEVWLPTNDNELLELSSFYCINSTYWQEELEQFWLCSQDFILSKGEGLPGRVWSSKQPEWIVDARDDSESYFLRNQIAKAFDIKTGFSMPIIVNQQVLMVLAFFTVNIYLKDIHTLEKAMIKAEPLKDCLLVYHE